MTTAYLILQGVIYFVDVLGYMLVVHALLSWFVRDPRNKFMSVLSRLTYPLVLPFQGIASKIVSKGVPFNIAPLLALVALRIISSLLYQLMYYLRAIGAV